VANVAITTRLSGHYKVRLLEDMIYLRFLKYSAGLQLWQM